MKRIIFYIGLHSPEGRKDRAKLREYRALNILSTYYDAFNVTHTSGMFEGYGEPSLRVEVIIDEPEDCAGFTRAEQAQDIAREIARTLEQDAVGLSIETLDNFQLITKD